MKRIASLALTIGLLVTTACASSGSTDTPAGGTPAPSAAPAQSANMDRSPPSPDPRVGLGAGLFDAEEAFWNMEMVSTTPPPEQFVGVTNSDLAFKDHYAIQGNYNGIQIWDITDPANPTLVEGYLCPASQSDVSVYGDLLFVSGEGFGGRLDCGAQGVQESVSHDRLRGIRIFDISDIRNPEYIHNVQTCRGSHTHTLLKDPDDDDHVYIYVSGSAPVRPAEELEGCVSAPPTEDPNSALFRIEVIQVPLADPTRASIVTSPRIFDDLEAPPQHGLAPDDLERIEEQRRQGRFVVDVQGSPQVVPNQFARRLLDSLVADRGGSGDPTAADSARLREILPDLVAAMAGTRTGPTQCHDITVYPAVGLAGGACGGYGLLLDIRDPANPVRIDAVADSNFSYWHSATFSNDGTKILFSDEWGGGGQPKCRARDPKEWGADAIFTIENNTMEFQSYYKLPAPQTEVENCVAHNGSMIPIPGREVMVQAWYQGGISVLDWTDPANPVEIAFHDRGPVNADQMANGGSWSVYWYNGYIYSSEIARGLDVFRLTPSGWLSQNELDAAATVELDVMNSQGQPQYEWPDTFALARAYVDQLERSRGLSADRIAEIRGGLAEAEQASGGERREELQEIAGSLEVEISRSNDAGKIRMLRQVVQGLAGM